MLELFAKAYGVATISGHSLYLGKEPAKYDLVMRCDREHVDLRDLTYPPIKTLHVYCGCVHSCQCEYLNLPTTFPGKLLLYNNSPTNPTVITTKDEYANYIRHRPKILFQHMYHLQFGLMAYNHYFEVNYGEIKSDYRFKLEQVGGNYTVVVSKKGYPLIKDTVRDLQTIANKVILKTTVDKLYKSVSTVSKLTRPIAKTMKVEFYC